MGCSSSTRRAGRCARQGRRCGSEVATSPRAPENKNLCQLHRRAEAVPETPELLLFLAFHVPATASGQGSETRRVCGSPGLRKSCEVVGKGCGSSKAKEMFISLLIFFTHALLAPEPEFHKWHCPSAYVLGCL